MSAQGPVSVSINRTSPHLLDRHASALVLIDVQKRLLPSMRRRAAVQERLSLLAKAARLMGVPTVFTEHTPEALGPVSSKLRLEAPEATVIGKRIFRSTAEAEFTAHLVNLGRDQIVIGGVEAHVCVLQTALGLLDRSYEVFVVEDAVTSRTKNDHKCALARMTEAGVTRVTTEMVLFEWLETGDHPAFAKLLPRIKALAAPR